MKTIHITSQDELPDVAEAVIEALGRRTVVALRGEMGAGKTTLCNLIPRFYDVTGGCIRIDGQDIRTLTQKSLREAIGMVQQEVYLFAGSVLENIAYGKPGASRAEVEEAARRVSADQVIDRMEQGYDTDVGEGGDRLSTGEKQLISFARAILAKPAIFVLDEATSSIDTWTEQLIQKATDELLAGHTSFMIAHRLSTVRNADLILVMKDGKIIEQGKHRELIGRKGHYYNLYSRQFEEECMMEIFD